MNHAVKSSALRAASLTMLALLYILGAPGFWSGVGWAQQIRQAPRPVRPDPPPVAEPAGGTLGTALASCDRESQARTLYCLARKVILSSIVATEDVTTSSAASMPC